MAKKKGAERVNISVPAHVRKQMAKRTDVNWSQVATSAFEKVLKTKEFNMSSVAERLRKSRESHLSDEYQNGFEEGRRWAAEDAEHHWLVNADAMHSQADSGLYDDAGGNSAYSVAEIVATWILEGSVDDVSRLQAREFWETVCGDDVTQSGEFTRGFVEGALEIFDAVRDDI